MPVLPPSAGEEIEPLSGGAAGQQRAGKNEMARITPEELDYIRTAAIGDMLGDSKELDKLGPAATVFRLCRELERMDREADWLIRERIVAEWNGRFVGVPNAAKDDYVVYPTKSEAVEEWR